MEAIHALDLKYHGVLHQSDLVVKDEEARRLKLRVVVLKDEVANLRDQLADKDNKIYNLSQQHDGIRAELERVNQTCITQESQLRLQARQHAELQVLLRPCISTNQVHLLNFLGSSTICQQHVR